METKETENGTDWTEKTAEEVEQEQKVKSQEKDAAELGALTEKVLYLMEKISEYGFLTMAEVQRVYTNKTYAYDVMKRLRGQGWIADFDTSMRPATGHYLTPQGYLALVKFGRLRVGARFRVERYKPFIFKHRLACARVGLALEKHPLVRNFTPESLLWKQRKSETDKLCDGQFRYGIPGRDGLEKVGLEVELTLKNKDRLAESFEQLARLELDQVWWICDDETVFRALRAQVMDRTWRRGPRHFFCLIDDFFAAKEHRIELMDAHGQAFAIDPAAPTLMPRETEPNPPPMIAERPAPPPPRPVYVFQPQTIQPAFVAPSAAPEAPPTPAIVAEPWVWKEPPLWSRVGSATLEFVQDFVRRVFDQERDPYATDSGPKFWKLVPLFMGLGVVDVVLLSSGPHAAAHHRPVTQSQAGPTIVWRTRPLAPVHSYLTDYWQVYPESLKSHGDHYLFKVRLHYTSSEPTLICGATIFDANDRPLQSVRFESSFFDRPYDWPVQIQFHLPSGSKAFGLALWGSFFDCRPSSAPQFRFKFD